MVENRGDLENFLKNIRTIEKDWRPIELEQLKRQVNGDPLQQLIAQLTAKLKALEGDASRESYLKYVEGEVLGEVRTIATRPDYEKARRTIGSVELVISRKTDEVIAILQDELTPIFSIEAPSNVIRRIVDEYLGVIQINFEDQLNRLPHLAALYQNDCTALGLFIQSSVASASAGSIGTDIIKHYALVGGKYLKHVMDDQMECTREFCNDSIWKLRYGQLDSEKVGTIDRCLSQGVLRITQLVKVLSPVCLSPKEFNSLLLPFTEFLMQWFWDGLLHNVKSMGRDVLPSLTRPISTLLNMNLDGTIPLNELYIAKLSVLQRLSGMNLIQVCNAFRKDEFQNAISLTEFRTLVQICYPDSSMKTAFVEEISSEIN